jgi:DNA-binding NarL/FixJ family response regulator
MPCMNDLTPRETAVCKQIATGATNRSIAATLNVTENTVEFHLRNIFQKLHIGSRTELAIYTYTNLTSD